MNDFGLSDADLFPLLDETGAANLRRLREHPYAPRYNWRTGERLDAAGLANVRAYAQKVRSSRTPWQAGALPPWVMPFVQQCRRDVPFYRGRETWSDEDFTSLPLTRRDHIRRTPWSFVPDGQATENLITYTTSGTTGTKLHIPATAELPNMYLPLIQHALATVGVKLDGGRRISIVHVCAQRGTVVLCSVSSYLGGAGFVKVNLDPADWNDPDDTVRFLDDCDAELIAGDPFALWWLAQMPTAIRPRAIVSAGTSLSAGLRARLGERFRCPVIDLYSMNETGPIAFASSASAEDGWEVLPPELYVEILDSAGRECEPGERGEIVVTGGLNACLPLVRYATGDFAAMRFEVGQSMPRLVGFEGRAPVSFRDTAGRWFNSLDATTALGPLALPDFSLRQLDDGSLVLRISGDDDDQRELTQAVAAIRKIFGESQTIDAAVDPSHVATGKRIRYASELPDPTLA
jgi:phenylacetate-CoA ligase